MTYPPHEGPFGAPTPPHQPSHEQNPLHELDTVPLRLPVLLYGVEYNSPPKPDCQTAELPIVPTEQLSAPAPQQESSVALFERTSPIGQTITRHKRALAAIRETAFGSFDVHSSQSFVGEGGLNNPRLLEHNRRKVAETVVGGLQGFGLERIDPPMTRRLEAGEKSPAQTVQEMPPDTLTGQVLGKLDDQASLERLYAVLDGNVAALNRTTSVLMHHSDITPGSMLKLPSRSGNPREEEYWQFTNVALNGELILSRPDVLDSRRFVDVPVNPEYVVSCNSRIAPPRQRA